MTAHRIIRRNRPAAAVIYWYQRSKYVTELDETFRAAARGRERAGIELSDFKVTFTIDWFNISSASRVGTFKIYNLSADTVNRITGQEFSKVRLIAGYDGIAPEVSASDVGTVWEVDAADVGQSDGRNYGLIFSGEIRYSVTGKDSPIDSYVLIQAADTDLALPPA